MAWWSINCTEICSRSQDVKGGEGIECESLSIQLPIEVPLRDHLDITWTSHGHHMNITWVSHGHHLLLHRAVCYHTPLRSLCQSFGSGFPRAGASGPSEQNQRELNSEHLRDVIRFVAEYFCSFHSCLIHFRVEVCSHFKTSFALRSSFFSYVH